MLHELGNHDADGKEIEEDGYESPEDDDFSDDEARAMIKEQMKLQARREKKKKY